MSSEIETLLQELKKAIAERDEARRWWCAVVANGCVSTDLSSGQLWQATLVAKTNGWDCFAEEISKLPNPWMYDHRNFDPARE